MNKVILMGRLTKDVELKVTQSGTNMCDFTIAVDRRFVKQGEERQTDFINCRAFGNTSAFIGKWFSKGRMISVVGSIQTRTWDDNEGKRHYVTEVIVDEVYFCGDRNNGQSNNTHAPSTTITSTDNPFPSNDLNEFVPVENNGDLPF